ncbi:single-stranded DNA-binding protein [Rhodoblastus acidophilus]|uniref:single-stranded DNA-binding protein n=1 Tax=Rhodoblastus acidophilus TaxID=1074 RepID=UPI00222549A7|nr:single-stranded DNA-binding protein [Rhodoblastus acidophilus]MCW2315107.1 single-stranded DNA-binding protein [Rhodoblastus acidophilus]
MSLYALAAGTLFRDPEIRTGKNGAFAVATLKWIEDAKPHYATCLAFEDDARAALVDLAKGDPVSIAGRLEVEQYEKDGAHRIALKIIAERVTPLKPRATTATTTNQRKTYDRSRC